MNSCEEVFQTELVCTKDFLRASFINKCCNSTGKTRDVIAAIASRNNPLFIGFLCEHAQGNGAELKLITPPDAPADDPARSMRERFVVGHLFGKHVMGTHGSRVIVRVETGPRQGRLYISRPCGSKPWAFAAVAKLISCMPKHPGENRLGQFAVLLPDNGPEGGYLVFFVKDPSRPFAKTHVGLKFPTAGAVRLHVSVFSSGDWSSHVYDPLVPPSTVTFQRSPYCIQAGSRLYMMYLVGLVAWFDVEQKVFGIVPLPGVMGTVVKGCLEYTAGPDSQGDLAIVHLDDGWLVRWVLTREGDMVVWNQEARVHLASAFEYLMNKDLLDALSVEQSDWHAIQIRSVSHDGRYTLLGWSMVCMWSTWLKKARELLQKLVRWAACSLCRRPGHLGHDEDWLARLAGACYKNWFYIRLMM